MEMTANYYPKGKPKNGTSSSKSLYWIDFKYKGRETRIKLEATNIAEAKKVARKQFGRKGKMISAVCVR